MHIHFRKLRSSGPFFVRRSAIIISFLSNNIINIHLPMKRRVHRVTTSCLLLVYQWLETFTGNLDLDGQTTELNFAIICYSYWLNDTISDPRSDDNAR